MSQYSHFTYPRCIKSICLIKYNEKRYRKTYILLYDITESMIYKQAMTLFILIYNCWCIAWKHCRIDKFIDWLWAFSAFYLSAALADKSVAPPRHSRSNQCRSNQICGRGCHGTDAQKSIKIRVVRMLLLRDMSNPFIFGSLSCARLFFCEWSPLLQHLRY